MENNYSKFNEMVDLEGLKADVEALEKNDRPANQKLPVGKYEVSIEKLQITETPWNTSQLSCWFKVLVGDYEGQMAFCNIGLTSAYGIVNAKNLLKSFESGLDVQFVDFVQFGNLVDQIYNTINGKKEYLVELYETVSKGKTYTNYKVEKVFDI